MSVDLAALRQELAAARADYDAATTVQQYLRVVDAAAQAARVAAGKFGGPQHQQRTPGGGAQGARSQAVPRASAPEASSDAAAVASASGADAGTGRAQDGRCARISGLPAGWGVARLKAFVERSGIVPLAMEKEDGATTAVIEFADAAACTRATRAIVGLLSDGRLPMRVQRMAAGANGGAPVLPAPGASQPPADATGAGAKRSAAAAEAAPAEGAAAGGSEGGVQAQRPAKQARTDIRDATCPLHDQPYAQQLESKGERVQEALDAAAQQVASYFRRVRQPPPSWVADAQSGGWPGLCLGSIMRSPQLEGYRNKSDFTIGHDPQERPTVGFLMGSFVDGLTAVHDPAACRHISPTALGLAAAMTRYLRSGATTLPPYDKRKGAGFWRLLLVREGRTSTFLPLPQQAAAAVDAAGAPGEGAAPGSSDWRLSEVPVEAWHIPLQRDERRKLRVSGPVPEAEPPTPQPDAVLVMVQVNPTATDSAGLERERSQLADYLEGAAKEQGLPPPVLLLQLHSGVSNAAAADAPVMPLRPPNASASGAAAATASGSGGEGAAATAITTFEDSLCELHFRVSATAFFQVNAGAACLLYRMCGDWAAPGPNTLLLDVCCGTGTIGQTLAGRVGHVIGIDNVASAIEDAAANAAINGITNVEYVCGNAEAVLGRLLKERAAGFPEVVAVVDPPRNGLHRAVLRALLGCTALKRLVYVSCNPDSLARDMAALCTGNPTALEDRAGGGGRGGRGRGSRGGGNGSGGGAQPVPFVPARCAAFDLFPHTRHVEAMVLLERP